MKKKAPVSACMIIRGDPFAEHSIRSVWEYVEEVVVVITAKQDDISDGVIERLRASNPPCKLIVEHFTDCNNEQDQIMDFSMARNKSFSLASQPWIMWLDGDDLVVGLEHLNELTQSVVPPDLQSICFLFPYEYSYDEQGNCTCRHFRERLCYGAHNYHFVGAVHECLVPKPEVKTNMLSSELITFKHQRQFHAKAVDPGRNYRILKNYFDNGGDDVRNMYYMGLEAGNMGLVPEAISYLERYISKSGWEDEKAMAAMRLVDTYQGLGDYQKELHWAFELLKIKHDWFESYYALCRGYYFTQQWAKCAFFGRLATQQPPTQTLLFVSQSDRFLLHTFLNVALNNIGDVNGAYQSCLEGLKGLPNHPHLTPNKTQYEKFLGIKHPIENLGEKSLVFVTAPWGDPWSPNTVKTTGIGGSEMMLIQMAKQMKDRGWNVRVYAACEGHFEGVDYRPANGFGNLSCDVLIVSRYANFLSDTYNVSANLSLLWCHDVCAANATNELLLKADRILALSEWHRQNLIKVHNLPPEQVIVTRNGIDLERFNKKIGKISGRCINSSSPDRSWPVLLELWPKIREQVAHAELHLFYGFANWKAAAAHDKLQTDLINRLEVAVKTTAGVVYHDRVNQQELADEFMKAEAWVFPSWFTETSCISAMEAQQADCHIITTKLAALIETCADYPKANLIEGIWTDKDYQDQFVAATIKALNAKV